MPRTSSQPFPQATQDMSLLMLSFLLYWGTFQLNDFLTPYVNYAQGVHLLFLPAGIKLVMVMVAGWRGALGCGLALLWLATHIWAGQALPVLAVYSALSVGVTYFTVGQVLSRRKLGPVLEGLTFWDIACVDAINTVVHGVVINLYFWSLGLRSGEDLWSTAMAMALGDFLGTGVVLLLVLLVARVLVPARR